MKFGSLLRKRASLYLAFVYGFVLIDFGSKFLLPRPLKLFSFFPLLAALLTRWLTKDKSPWLIGPNFRKSWKTYLLAAFVPSLLIFFSAMLYFFIFPTHLDLSASRLIDTYSQFGMPTDLPHTVESVITLGMVGVFLSPFILPIILFALGEEVGWRGYFLPILLQLMSEQKAILLSGLLWGIGHAPLVYLGLNYGFGYPGAPYLGIVAMTLFCVVLGIWLAYVTIKSESVIPAAILHGSINFIGEFPALVAITGINPLIGPSPGSLIGGLGLLVGAVILWGIMGTNKFHEASLMTRNIKSQR